MMKQSEIYSKKFLERFKVYRKSSPPYSRNQKELAFCNRRFDIERQFVMSTLKK